MIKSILNNSTNKRILNNSFWSLLGSIFSQFILLISSISIARILGITEFGEYGMILYSVNLFGVFAAFGLGLTATKYIAEFKNTEKLKAGNIIGLTSVFALISGLIISISIVIFSKIIANNIINAPHLENGIKIGAIIIFFNSLTGVKIGILNGFESFKKIAILNTLTVIISIPIQILLTQIYGLEGCLYGFGLYYFVQFLFSTYYVNIACKENEIFITYNNLKKELNVIIDFSLPALLSGLLVSIVIWLSTTFLSNQPNGYNNIGIFNAANQWRNAILFIPGVLSQIVLPMLSSSNNNRIKFNKILKINIYLNFIIASVIALIISVFSNQIMSSYGDEFSEGVDTLILLSISTVLISINNVIGQAIFAKDKTWYGFLLNLIWGLTIIYSSYYFVNNGYGAKGLALSYLIGYTLHTVLTALFTYYILIKKDNN